jgi:hypothetical protein
MTWHVIASGASLDETEASSVHLCQGAAMQRTALFVTLGLFSALTAVALWQHGYWGIIAPHFQSFGAGQVFADLVIALSLFLVWMWRDARANGRNPWPWLLLVATAGSIGALLYLLWTPQQTALLQPRQRASV